MKKLLFIICIMVLNTNLYSQINLKNIQHVPTAETNTVNDTNNPSLMGGDEILWSEDFEDIDNVITEDIAGFGDWKWSDQAPGGQWSENAGVIPSETPENGFMLMEADFYNTSPQNGVADGEVGENQIHAQFTIGPIDLSSSETEELVLQFYSNYRICCFYSPSESNDMNVYISTDDGVTFNDLDYSDGNNFEVNVEEEILSQIPLGNFAPNTTNVYFRFEWIGTHYYWMIDDLAVIQRPAYDLKMLSSWLVMEDPASIEYYAIPENQMPEEMLIGAEVYNYGFNDDSNVTLNGAIDNTSIYTSFEYELVESDSTSYIETDYFDVSMLTQGTYTFTAEILSSGDDTSEDNILTREFMVSDRSYALGGLYDSYEWMGTGWPGGDDTADGVRYANYFDIKEETTLSSIKITLDTNEHPTSLGTFECQAGGEIIAYVCDTTGIFDPLVTTLDPDFGGAIWTSDFYLVSDDDVSSGEIVIDVPELNLPSNAYYIAVEMYSNGLQSDILILDDTSVLQPWYASLVFYPNDQTWYSNPNAASIEIGLDGFENSIAENTLNGINYFPNPTSNYLEITSNNLLYGKCDLLIYNTLGELVKHTSYDEFKNRKTINLNNMSAGAYILEFRNLEKINRYKLVVE